MIGLAATSTMNEGSNEGSRGGASGGSSEGSSEGAEPRVRPAGRGDSSRSLLLLRGPLAPLARLMPSGVLDAEQRVAEYLVVVALAMASMAAVFTVMFALHALPVAVALEAITAVLSIVTVFISKRSRKPRLAGRILLTIFLCNVALGNALLGSFSVQGLLWLVLLPPGAAVLEASPAARFRWFLVAIAGMFLSYIANDLLSLGLGAVPLEFGGPINQLITMLIALAAFAGVVELFVREANLSGRREVALAKKLASTERLVSLGTLAAGLAHEINNPIAYVASNLSFARAELERRGIIVEGDDLWNALGDAEHGVRRVRDVTSRMQRFGAPRKGESKSVSASLRACVDEALRLCDNEIRHSGSVTLEYEAKPLVPGSEGMLSHVFMNLLVNAGYALRSQSRPATENRIVVRVYEHDNQAICEVEDNGPGVPPELRERVFDPFFTTKEVGKGTGLGLAIAQQTVAACGGRIEVLDAPGGGALFRVSLPLVGEQAAPVRQRGRPEPVAAAGTLRILIVDDDLAIRRTLKRVMRPHAVTDVEGGQPALDLLGKSPDAFDIILCDVMMPEMSGVEFYKRLEAGHAAKVVFMTGGVFDSDWVRFIEGTGRPLLQKPFERSELEAALRREVH